MAAEERASFYDSCDCGAEVDQERAPWTQQSEQDHHNHSYQTQSGFNGDRSNPDSHKDISNANRQASKWKQGQNSRLNGHQWDDIEAQKSSPTRSRFSAALQTFSPIWFALVMNSGILGIMMHQIPHPYNGQWLQICSYILYLTSLVLFFTFTCIYLLRAILYPGSVPGPLKSQPALTVEATAISACIPISAFTIIAQTALIASAANWHESGHGFMLFCYVAWWCVVVWILVIAQATLINLTRKASMSTNEFPPAIIIPGVGLVTAAFVGTVVVTEGHSVSPQLAVPVIIVGYLLVGWGIFWAIFVYSAYFVKLLSVGWPAPEKIPTLVFLVGPPGQTAGALIALGSESLKYFPLYQANFSVDSSSQEQRPLIFTDTGAQTFSAIGFLLAFLFLGLYALWLIFALYGILETALAGKIRSFSFSWWGTIFPTATGGLAFIRLANNQTGIGSQAFAILGCIWLVVLLIDYLTCWLFTIRGVINGQLLDGRTPEEKERAVLNVSSRKLD